MRIFASVVAIALLIAVFISYMHGIVEAATPPKDRYFMVVYDKQTAGQGWQTGRLLIYGPDFVSERQVDQEVNKIDSNTVLILNIYEFKSKQDYLTFNK